MGSGRGPWLDPGNAAPVRTDREAATVAVLLTEPALARYASRFARAPLAWIAHPRGRRRCRAVGLGSHHRSIEDEAGEETAEELPGEDRAPGFETDGGIDPCPGRVEVPDPGACQGDGLRAGDPEPSRRRSLPAAHGDQPLYGEILSDEHVDLGPRRDLEGQVADQADRPVDEQRHQAIHLHHDAANAGDLRQVESPAGKRHLRASRDRGQGVAGNPQSVVVVAGLSPSHQRHDVHQIRGLARTRLGDGHRLLRVGGGQDGQCADVPCVVKRALHGERAQRAEAAAKPGVARHRHEPGRRDVACGVEITPHGEQAGERQLPGASDGEGAADVGGPGGRNVPAVDPDGRAAVARLSRLVGPQRGIEAMGGQVVRHLNVAAGAERVAELVGGQSAGAGRLSPQRQHR